MGSTALELNRLEIKYLSCHFLDKSLGKCCYVFYLYKPYFPYRRRAVCNTLVITNGIIQEDTIGKAKGKDLTNGTINMIFKNCSKFC